MTGFVDLYVLFFIHIGSRQVFVTGVTANPDATQVAQQSRNASMQMAECEGPASLHLVDHDAKLARAFEWFSRPTASR
jgi:hypothetical protein